MQTFFPGEMEPPTCDLLINEFVYIYLSDKSSTKPFLYI